MRKWHEVTNYMLPDVLLDRVGRFASRTLIGVVHQLDVTLFGGFCGVCHSCLFVTFSIRCAMSRKGFAVRTSETARTDQRVNVLTSVPSLYVVKRQKVTIDISIERTLLIEGHLRRVAALLPPFG